MLNTASAISSIIIVDYDLRQVLTSLNVIGKMRYLKCGTLKKFSCYYCYYQNLTLLVKNGNAKGNLKTSLLQMNSIYS